MPRVHKYKNMAEPGRGSKGKKSRRQGHFSLGDLLLKLFAIAGAMALLLSYISVYLKPSQLSSVLMFFGLYYIPILFFNLIIFIIALLRLHGAVLYSDSNETFPCIKTAYTAYPDAVFARVFAGEEFIVLATAQIL